MKMTDGANPGLAVRSDLIDHLLATVAGNVGAIVTLLGRPGAVIDTETPNKESNRLRRLRGLKALPPLHRVVHLNRTVSRAASNATDFGNQKSPHDRRAHTGHYRTGKVMTVRSCEVKGGADGLSIYDVKD